MFGVEGEPVVLPGGEGQSYRVGNLVLKPTTDAIQSRWIAELLRTIPEVEFRVIQPAPTVDEKWVYSGWEANYFIEGETVKGRWKDKITVSRKFHSQLHGVERPDFIGSRNNPWETADRIVWNEIREEYGENISHISSRLLRMKKPVNLEEQLIHGDMTGNILFHVALPPAVIDFSPYWRPTEYATAIIIVDAIVWEGADDTLLSEMPNTFQNNQLLIRAALWRIKTTELFSIIRNTDPTHEIEQYDHFIDGLAKRIGAQL